MEGVKIPNIKVNSFEADLKENDRLFFSSKFGKGKTTFLKYFFENREDEYLTIYLNPVFYSVNDNLDVFKLLEVDIASELLKHLKAELTIPKALVYSEIVNNRVNDIAVYIFQLLEKTGKPMHNGIIKLIRAIDIIKQKSEDEYNSLTSGNYGAVEYFLRIKESELPERGNLFSGVISEVLAEDSRQKVLVIDDLDRLDPAHLFRVLNVFSNSFYEDTNGEGVHKRLGFDKIVLVGHYDNIKGIFHHRYGDKVDFGGYFNKFHEKVHKFDYSQEAVLFIRNGLSHSFTSTNQGFLNLLNNYLTDIQNIISEILFVLFQRNYIDWRCLHNISVNPISEKHYPAYIRNAGLSPMCIILFYLCDIIDTPAELLRIFEELSSKNDFTQLKYHSGRYKEAIFSNLSPLLVYNLSAGTELLIPKTTSLNMRFQRKTLEISVNLKRHDTYNFYVSDKKTSIHLSPMIIDRSNVSLSAINFYFLWGVFLLNTIDNHPDLLVLN